MNSMLLWFVIIYWVISVGIGLWAALRVRTSGDYAVASRALPLPIVTATVFATWFGSETVLGIPATFLREGLGFTYAAVDRQAAPRWQDYLERQYRHIADLDDAWGLAGAARFGGFADVPLPDAMPTSGVRLRDWIYFVSVVAPTAENAHRFTVLVPVGVKDTVDSQQQRLAIARRVAEREKPAHTRCRVRLYWAMFRVGEARVGFETLLGDSSRFVAIQLGRTALATGFLAWTEPWNVRGRMVVGRDRVRFVGPTETGEP